MFSVVLMLALAMSTSGCTNRLMAGMKKLFVRPAQAVVAKTQKLFDRSGTHAQASTEQVSSDIRPVMAIEDSAGRPVEKASQPTEDAAPADSEAASTTEAGSTASQPVAPSAPALTLEGVITPEMAARYREDLVAKPFDALVRYNMGRLYLQQGLLNEAAYEFDMATSLDQNFTYAFILLGRTLRLRGQHDLALAKFTTATKLQPDLALTYTEAGVCWDQRGYHERAREQYTKALALTPGDGRLYNNIGYSYFLEEEYTAALKAYRSALQLNPSDRQAHNNIAMAYSMQKKWDKALHHFTQALGEAAAQNNIGHLLLRAGKVDEALAHLELAVRLKPDSLRALGNLESALRMKGRIDDAAKLHAQIAEIERAQARTNLTTDGSSASVKESPQH
jgi:Flp pilus assembly protein TadD